MMVCCFCEEWGDGGIESFLLNILEHMDLSDIELDIITTKKKSDLYMPRIKALGVGFTELSGNSRRLFFNHIVFRKLLRERQYDVVYLNIYQAMSLLYAKDAKQIGVKMRIAHSHNNGLRKSFTKFLKLIIHYTCRYLLADYATDYWACSESAARFMFRKKNNFQYIPNGIEVERFLLQSERREQVRRDLGITDHFVIGNVGRLCYQKNQEFLLNVIYELRKSNPKVILLIVGDGENREGLKKLAKHLGIQENVIFFGTTSDVAPLLWAMDVFAFPSRFEGLGIAVIEAQAAGLRVLCSDSVPQEARVTELVDFLPLNAGAKLWAERLNAKPGNSHRGSTEMIIRAGYDITIVSRKIQNTWLKAHEDRFIIENM